MLLRHLPLLAFGIWTAQPGAAYVSQRRDEEGTCKKTTVAILGAGIAGIAAAEALSNASMSDFLILEYRDRIGGRAWHENFGKKEDGSPYVVEMGANWVQGLGNPGGPENPIWTLAKEFGLQTTYSNYSNVSTYNEHGYKDYSHLLDQFDEAYDIASPAAGQLLVDNLQDQTAKAGLALAGWKPKSHDMEAQAVDWWSWDFESAYTPQESSFIFGVASGNLTSNQFSDHDNFVTDQRGFNHIIKGMASKFMKEEDPRLLLNTIITNITYTPEGVTIHSKDGTCVQAAYAICTFSLGVLQNDAVTFIPELPEWKQTAIHMFTMATYTKIFMQFNQTFWPTDTQYFLYADPTTRGYYPLLQSLSMDGFHPNSNISFMTVTEEMAYRAERQSDETTKNEIVAVLQNMFPDVAVPEPTAFMYPRWSTEPWAYGTYSNWPMGTTLEMHQNLRANTDRLWFAGEATSPSYFGFMHGAWFEGRAAGREIAAALGGCKRNSTACGKRKHYDDLRGTTPLADYSFVNGWTASSFYDSNDD
ncbi:hypothetical protein BDV25DRAFT_138010 [Aspergillus avenaceus]|uniref:Amine oxidase n=1 Tax=Aspergillus avenaceus TaxID=36643 RepID=A0A5N6U128_ASPAV|nr:hypothetical protein BDV25DRAFT_138010 [Aspergillus avenaceus]